MTSDTTPPPLLDAIKASTLRLKEKQSALDARARELDALKARLEASRTELDERTAKLAAEREAFMRERDALDDVRASMERDLAAINQSQETTAREQGRLQRLAQALSERETAVKETEARVDRLEHTFTDQVVDAETKLRAALERGEQLMKLQASWLATFQTQEKELHAIGEQLRARQDELGQQQESFTALKGVLDEELRKLIEAQEKLATKERSILEAETFLASAMEAEGDASNGERVAAVPPQAPTPTAPEPVPPSPVPESTAVPEPSPEPAPEPEPQETPAPAPVQEAVLREPDAPPQPTKAEATERLTKAVEAWKRARDAGWKVTDIRKTVKEARDAVEAGDYERVARMASEILEQLQAPATPR